MQQNEILGKPDIGSIREAVNFMTKYQLTPGSFILCWLLMEKKEYRYSEYSTDPLFYQYCNEVGDEISPFSVTDARIAIERGFLEIIEKDKTIDDLINVRLDNLKVTNKFQDEFWIEAVVAGEELWNNYPNFLQIKGKQNSAKSCNKEALIVNYMKKVSHSREKHNYVMDMLDKAKRNDLINMGIEKWVASEQWNVVRDFQEEEEDPYAQV